MIRFFTVYCICSENCDLFVFISVKSDLYCFQASKVGMTCTYIDLCPLTPDDRYIAGLETNFQNSPTQFSSLYIFTFHV